MESCNDNTEFTLETDEHIGSAAQLIGCHLETVCALLKDASKREENATHLARAALRIAQDARDEAEEIEMLIMRRGRNSAKVQS